jgi:hypothetical protein
MTDIKKTILDLMEFIPFGFLSFGALEKPLEAIAISLAWIALSIWRFVKKYRPLELTAIKLFPKAKLTVKDCHIGGYDDR